MFSGTGTAQLIFKPFKVSKHVLTFNRNWERSRKEVGVRKLSGSEERLNLEGKKAPERDEYSCAQICILVCHQHKDGVMSCETILYGCCCFPESFHVRRGNCVNGFWEFSFPKLEFGSYLKLDICPDNYLDVNLIRLRSNLERYTRSCVKKKKRA